jgi:hypothetical protein
MLLQNCKEYPHTSTPWNLEGESCMFVGSAPSSGYPAGTYFPGMIEDRENFIGGTSALMLLTYTNTNNPIGPYHELVFIPGFFKTPDGKSGWRVTQIYVDSQHSLQEGRRIWGTPKHFANFDWKKLSSNVNELTVTLEDKTVIFRAKITDSKIPAFPIHTWPLPTPFTNIVQTGVTKVGTDAEDGRYLSTPLKGSGWAKVAYIEGQGGDGKYMPKLADLGYMWKTGVHISPLYFTLETPTEL